MKNISATTKGVITGVVMILFSLSIWYFRKSFDNMLQYVVYVIYVAGIVWTLLDHSRNNSTAGSFKSFFGQGFKCFVVVTLFMVIFTAVFIYLHPELKTEYGAMVRTQMLRDGNKTPAEIAITAIASEKMFLTGYVMAAVFGYLAIGALVTLLGSGFLSQKKKV